MNLKEACEKLEVDYVAISNRFAGNDSIYIKFLKKFLEDNTYYDLELVWKEKDYVEIEKTAYTLKGVAGNLGLERLFYVSNKLVQQLRKLESGDIESTYEELKKEYQLTREVITNIDE